MTAVMIIENAARYQEALTLMVGRLGTFRLVGIHARADDAIAALAAEAPQIVILDVALDTGNGLAVLKAIVRDYPFVRVAVYSGHDDEYMRSYFMRAGAKAYFIKDIDAAALETWLQDCKV